MATELREFDEAVNGVTVTAPVTKSGRKRGAQPGNQSRTTHGVRGFLVLGTYPKGTGHIKGRLGAFRIALEAAIVSRDGEVSIYAGALIQAACQHEGRRQLLHRWLVKESPLPLSDRMAILRDAGAAVDSRNKCLERLGLDKRADDDPWAALDATHCEPNAQANASHATTPTHDQQATSQPNASQAVVGDVAQDGSTVEVQP